MKIFKKWRLLVIIGSTLLMAGCLATGAVDQMQSVNQRADAVDNFSQAVNMANPVSINRGKRIATSITLKDPVLILQSPYAERAYKSNYKVFKFYADQGATYNLDVITVCDCMGFRKFILSPKGFIVNDRGEVFASNPLNRITLKEAFTPFQDGGLHGVWSFTAPSDGAYYFIVAANNENSGSSVYRTREMVSAGSSFQEMTFDLLSYPTGKIVVRLK